MLGATRLKGTTLYIAMLFLIWNIIGVGAFAAQASMDLDRLARTDAYQAHLFATMPLWAWAAYAVAIFAGLGGAVTLFRRSRLAEIFYMLSIAGIVLQFGRTFLVTDIIAVKGWSAVAFPLFILLLAVVQLAFAVKLNHARARESRSPVAA